MEFEKVKAILAKERENLLKNAHNLECDGVKLDMYRVRDVYTAFVNKHISVGMDVFTRALSEQNWCIVCKTTRNQIWDLVGEKTKVSLDQLRTVQQKMEAGEEVKVKSSVFDSDEEEERIVDKVKKPKLSEPTLNFQSKPKLGIQLEPMKDTMQTSLPKSKRFFPEEDEFDDTDDEYFNATVNQSKTSNTKLAGVLGKNLNKNVQGLSFETLRERIIESFEKNPILPIQQLNAAMCKKFGVGFDWKTQVCTIFKHKHGNLKKFMMCCKEFVSTLTFKNVYLKCRTNMMQNIIEKRKLTYNVAKKHPKFKGFIEILICNLFSIKCTIPFEDLLKLFENVYGLDLEKLIEDTSVKAFLCTLKSDNILVLQQADHTMSVTICPFMPDETFRDLKDQNLQEEIEQIEKKIDMVEVCVDKQRKNTVSGLYALQTRYKNMYEEGGLNTELAEKLNKKYDKEMILLIQKADLNIPKKLQVCDTTVMPDKYKYTAMWKYVVVNVNVDEKVAFNKN